MKIIKNVKKIFTSLATNIVILIIAIYILFNAEIEIAFIFHEYHFIFSNIRTFCYFMLILEFLFGLIFEHNYNFSIYFFMDLIDLVVLSTEISFIISPILKEIDQIIMSNNEDSNYIINRSVQKAPGIALDSSALKYFTLFKVINYLKVIRIAKVVETTKKINTKVNNNRKIAQISMINSLRRDSKIERGRIKKNKLKEINNNELYSKYDSEICKIAHLDENTVKNSPLRINNSSFKIIDRLGKVKAKKSAGRLLKKNTYLSKVSRISRVSNKKAYLNPLELFKAIDSKKTIAYSDLNSKKSEINDIINRTINKDNNKNIMTSQKLVRLNKSNIKNSKGKKTTSDIKKSVYFNYSSLDKDASTNKNLIFLRRNSVVPPTLQSRLNAVSKKQNYLKEAIDTLINKEEKNINNIYSQSINHSFQDTINKLDFNNTKKSLLKTIKDDNTNSIKKLKKKVTFISRNNNSFISSAQEVSFKEDKSNTNDNNMSYSNIFIKKKEVGPIKLDNSEVLLSQLYLNNDNHHANNEPIQKVNISLKKRGSVLHQVRNNLQIETVNEVESEHNSSIEKIISNAKVKKNKKIIINEPNNMHSSPIMFKYNNNKPFNNKECTINRSNSSDEILKHKDSIEKYNKILINKHYSKEKIIFNEDYSTIKTGYQMKGTFNIKKSSNNLKKDVFGSNSNISSTFKVENSSIIDKSLIEQHKEQINYNILGTDEELLNCNDANINQSYLNLSKIGILNKSNQLLKRNELLKNETISDHTKNKINTMNTILTKTPSYNANDDTISEKSNNENNEVDYNNIEGLNDTFNAGSKTKTKKEKLMLEVILFKYLTLKIVMLILAIVIILNFTQNEFMENLLSTNTNNKINFCLNLFKTNMLKVIDEENNQL